MIDTIKKLYKKYEEIINYLIVGGMTTVVSWGAQFICAYTILTRYEELIWQNMLLSFINWTAGVIFAYFTNRKFVFKSTETNRLKEAGKFVSSRIATLFLDMIVKYVTVNIFGINLVVATIISSVLVIIANYILSKLLVFTKKGTKENGENR